MTILSVWIIMLSFLWWEIELSSSPPRILTIAKRNHTKVGILLFLVVQNVKFCLNLWCVIRPFPLALMVKNLSVNAGDTRDTVSIDPWVVKIPRVGNSSPLRASLVVQLVKNLPAMWETWVRSLGWEDPRRRERLPTPVFWPGEFHGLYSPWGRKESDTTERLSLSPVFFPGKFHDQRSLVGYSPWSHKELDTTEHNMICDIWTQNIYWALQHKGTSQVLGYYISE